MHVEKFTPEQLQFFSEIHRLPVVNGIGTSTALIDTFSNFERVTGYTIEKDGWGNITALHPPVSTETGYADPDIVPDLDVSRSQLNSIVAHVELDLVSGEIRVGADHRVEENGDNGPEDRVLRRVAYLVEKTWNDHVDQMGRTRAAESVSDDAIADNFAHIWSKKNAEGDWILDNELVSATAPGDLSASDEYDALQAFAAQNEGCVAKLTEDGRAILFGRLIQVAHYLASAVRTEAINDREWLDVPDDVAAELEEPRFEHAFERTIERWGVDCVDVTEWPEFAETEQNYPAFVWLRDHDQSHPWAQEEAREFSHAWARLGWNEKPSEDWEGEYLAIAILYASPLHTGTWYRKSLDEDSLRVVTAAKNEAWETWRDSDEYDPEIDRFQIYLEVEERAGKIWSEAQDADFA